MHPASPWSLSLELERAAFLIWNTLRNVPDGAYTSSRDLFAKLRGTVHPLTEHQIACIADEMARAHILERRAIEGGSIIYLYRLSIGWQIELNGEDLEG
jgi:hypothetical protein